MKKDPNRGGSWGSFVANFTSPRQRMRARYLHSNSRQRIYNGRRLPLVQMWSGLYAFTSAKPASGLRSLPTVFAPTGTALWVDDGELSSIRSNAVYITTFIGSSATEAAISRYLTELGGANVLSLICGGGIFAFMGGSVLRLGDLHPLNILIYVAVVWMLIVGLILFTSGGIIKVLILEVIALFLLGAVLMAVGAKARADPFSRLQELGIAYTVMGALEIVFALEVARRWRGLRGIVSEVESRRRTAEARLVASEATSPMAGQPPPTQEA